MELICPTIKCIEERERAPPALVSSRVGIEATLFAVGLNGVEVGEIFDRDGGTPIFGEQCGVKFGADVHAAAG